MQRTAIVRQQVGARSDVARHRDALRNLQRVARQRRLLVGNCRLLI